MTLDDRLIDFDTWCLCGKEECVLSENFAKNKQAILSDLIEIIGEDAEHEKGYTKPAPELGKGYSYYSPSCYAIDGFECNCGASLNNQIRQELRQKVKKYCE